MLPCNNNCVVYKIHVLQIAKHFQIGTIQGFDLPHRNLGGHREGAGKTQRRDRSTYDHARHP